MLQQIAFNHTAEIGFKDFINLYKKCTSKPYSFLVIDTSLASDNSPRFRKNLLEKLKKLIMTIVNKIRDEKQQVARREQRSSKNISIIIR